MADFLQMHKIFAMVSAGDFMEAHIAINKMIEAEPNRLSLYNNRGMIYRGLGRHEDAYLDYEKVINESARYTDKGKEDMSVAYYNRGNLSKSLSRMDEALADFDSCIQIDPNYYEAFTSKVEVLVRTGKRDEAYATLEEAIKVKPQDPTAYVARGFMRLTEDRDDEARTDLEKAWKLGRDQAHPTTKINWQVVHDLIVNLGGDADPKFNI